MVAGMRRIAVEPNQHPAPTQGGTYSQLIHTCHVELLKFPGLLSCSIFIFLSLFAFKERVSHSLFSSAALFLFLHSLFSHSTPPLLYLLVAREGGS